MLVDAIVGAVSGGAIVAMLFLSGQLSGSWFRNKYAAWKARRNPPPPEPEPTPEPPPVEKPNEWFPHDDGRIVPPGAMRAFAHGMYATCAAFPSDPGAAAFRRESEGEKLTDGAIFASVAGDLLTESIADLWQREIDDRYMLSEDAKFRMRYARYNLNVLGHGETHSVILATHAKMMATLRAAENGDVEAADCVRLTVEQMRIRHQARKLASAIVAVKGAPSEEVSE